MTTFQNDDTDLNVLFEKQCNILCDINDISSKNDVLDFYKNSIVKKWIKMININDTIDYDIYNQKEHFIPIANVVLDEDLKVNSKKKRKTLIKFVPLISNELFNEKAEWLYIFVINNKIVKIGGTRTGLGGRVGSYLCGHHVQERGKSGDCSKTNAYIYNTFHFYLCLGCDIKMYGYKLPKTELTIQIFGKETKILAQTFHAYESRLLEEYKKDYNNYPILSDNCDPDYKN